MPKRAVAALLWFAMIWVGYEIIWSVAGVPRPIGPIVAAAVAGFVGLDPVGMFWPRSTTSLPSVRPVETSQVHS
jgi:hypothetical protein